MPQIKPIPAITYTIHSDGDASSLVAPPYDVLTNEDKRDLLASCTRNIVAIDLPHLPVGRVGPDEVYQHAGETFRPGIAGVARQLATTPRPPSPPAPRSTAPLRSASARDSRILSIR